MVQYYPFALSIFLPHRITFLEIHRDTQIPSLIPRIYDLCQQDIQPCHLGSSSPFNAAIRTLYPHGYPMSHLLHMVGPCHTYQCGKCVAHKKALEILKKKL